MQSVKNNEYTYNLANLLGSGSFGSVFRCTRTRDKKEFALKIIDKVKLRTAGEYLLEALKREIATQTIATQSEIPFFVGLYDHFEESNKIYIILELCEQSLLQFSSGKKFSEAQAKELIFQIAIGLDYLHSVDICHRDIKPENVLIKDGYLKIADFGFATSSSMLTTHLGTKPYMSPEYFNVDVEEFTPKIDVWALNTCFYLFLTSKFYFFSNVPMEMERLIARKEFVLDASLANLSPESCDLLKRGYEKNPTRRPTMHEYVMHPAFSNYRAKYAKYLDILSNRGSVGELNRVLENIRVSTVESDNKIYLRYLLNFRNNSLEYSRFSAFLRDQGLNSIVAFLLVKKHIQNAAALFISITEARPPGFGGFAAVQINADDWRKCCKGLAFAKLRARLARDIEELSLLYSQLYKNLLNADPSGSNLPQFDLNVAYSEELVAFCTDFGQKYKVLGIDLESAELKAAVSAAQRIVVYEKYHPEHIVLY